MLMVWDEVKRRRNLMAPPEGHGLDFADARDRFDFATARITPAHPGEDGRERFLAIGKLDRGLVAFVFSPLGTEAISAISLRTASRKERKSYGTR